MEMCTREKYTKGKSRVQESTCTRMEINLKESGRVIRKKEKEHIGQPIRKV